jgi:hypothetical protein
MIREILKIMVIVIGMMLIGCVISGEIENGVVRGHGIERRYRSIGGEEGKILRGIVEWDEGLRGIIRLRYEGRIREEEIGEYKRGGGVVIRVIEDIGGIEWTDREYVRENWEVLGYYENGKIEILRWRIGWYMEDEVEVIKHEIGHSLGMGHGEGVMSMRVGKGGEIGEREREGIKRIYGIRE